MAQQFWQNFSRSQNTLVLFLLLLVLAGCQDLFTCKDEPVGPDPGSGQDAFAVAKIARWDGNEWHSLGKGVTSVENDFASVNDIVVHENLVYVGGTFDFAGEYEVNSIARWSGSSWQGFGNLVFPGVHRDYPTNKGTVNAIALTGSGAAMRMFVGGDFQAVYNDSLEGLYANNLAIFDFNSSLWRTMGEGAGGEVEALAIQNDLLYVAGKFPSVDHVPNTSLIARWNSATGRWSDVGAGLYGYGVYTLLRNGNDLYAGGQFSMTGGDAPVNNIARWDGSRWNALASGLNGAVYDLAFWGGELYAAGQFFTESYEQFHALALWREGAWTLLGDRISPNGEESYRIRGLALAANGNSIFLGGRFANMGGRAVNHVARWDNASWFDLTGGAHEIGEASLSGVRALGVLGTNIFAGGTFSFVGQM